MTDKDEGKTATYGAVVLKPLTWPGSYTIAQGSTWAHIYVGYGLKAGSLPINPTAPNDVNGDIDEQEEQPEVFITLSMYLSVLAKSKEPTTRAIGTRFRRGEEEERG